MSVWGKVSGAAAGLLVGGPVGALVGAVAGHFIFDRETDPGVAFTIAVIAHFVHHRRWHRHAQ